MAKQYFLSKNGNHVGPFSFEEVLGKLESKEQQWTDYVYDDSLQDWTMLMEHPEFSEALNSAVAKPGTTKTHEKPMVSMTKEHGLREKEWFLLKEGNNYGPFSRLDLVQMLQEKTLFEFDYVWHQSMTAWKRLAEIEEFSPDKIRDLKHSGDVDISEIFFRRRHARARYGCSLIVHNSKTVFKGQSLEISEGGAGVVIENSTLQPGQTLYLHFQPGDGVPPFNAVCTVVSKSWIKEAQSETPPVKYGVRFTSISQTAKDSIRDFTQKRVQAA